MPYIISELEESYLSVVRPTIYNVTRQLMDKMGVFNDNIPIKMVGSDGKLNVLNSENITTHETTDFNNDERILVEYQDEYNEDELITLQSKKHENTPIWWDRELGIKLYPVYSRSRISISYTYQANNRTQVDRFRNHWRRKIAENREYMSFHTETIIPIPKTSVKVLGLLYQNVKKHNPNYPTFRDYLFKLGSPYLTTLTNGEGKGDTLAIAEKQTMFYGNFTDEKPPEAQKQEKGDIWHVSFNFEFTFDKPISYGVKYPIAIYNDLVSPYLYPEPLFDPRELRAECHRSRDYFFQVQALSGLSWYKRGACIRIPYFDEWSCELNWYNNKPLLTALVFSDENNPRYVCNLAVMDKEDGWGLNDAIIPYFKENRDKLTKINQFPFLVSIYINDTLMNYEDILIDEELNVTLRVPMNPKKSYRLVISAMYSTKQLYPKAQLYFLNNPPLVNMWLDIILGHIPSNGYPKVLTNGSVDPNSLARIVQTEHIPNNHEAIYLGEPTGSIYACVGIFSITTRPQGDFNGIS